ncbi:MAG: nucleotidyltransferase domain-containing protein [Candidatus Methanospirareceae archaeon]
MNKLEIAKEFAKSLKDVEKIILFGSVARGEDKGDSDVDILIISRNKQKTKDKAEIEEEEAKKIIEGAEKFLRECGERGRQG